MTQVVGRTSESYDDFHRDDPQPRIYALKDTESGEPIYMAMPPCGHRAHLSEKHQVEEERDGTFTIRPHPENSNSILCRACGWHGYVNRNIWQPV